MSSVNWGKVLLVWFVVLLIVVVRLAWETEKPEEFIPTIPKREHTWTFKHPTLTNDTGDPLEIRASSTMSECDAEGLIFYYMPTDTLYVCDADDSWVEVETGGAGFPVVEPHTGP